MNSSEEDAGEGVDESCTERNVGEGAEANTGEVTDESYTEGEAGEGPEVEGPGQ